MSAPKVSVIVPVYKAEAYLHRCVDSLLAQTLAEFELLLVDDGSPDGSGAICDGYAARDSRVRVFHKSNGGVSSARQCGVDNACGEYIIHADPDDWVEPTMLEELYTKAVNENVDVVICDYFIECISGTYYSKQQPSKNDALTVLREFFAHLHGACWNKLLRREAILRYNVRFDEQLSFCEDLYYNSTLLLNPVRIAYLPKAFYHYDQIINTNSIVTKYTARSLEYDKMLCDKFVVLFAEHSYRSIVEKHFVELQVSRAFMSGVFSTKEFRMNFEKYSSIIKNYSSITDINRYLYYLSCKGYYRLVYGIYMFLKNIKALLR